MKSQFAWVVTIGVLILGVSVGLHLQAETGPLALDKIGVVNIVQVMSQSKKHGEQMGGLQALQAQHQAELQTLATELDTEQGTLQTLRPDSEDYLKQLKVVIEKEALLKSRQEYYQRSLQAKERDLTERAYQAALAATDRVAEAQGLKLVLEQSAPEFPVPAENLIFAIRSHKVLYSKGCLDITDAVLVELDR